MFAQFWSWSKTFFTHFTKELIPFGPLPFMGLLFKCFSWDRALVVLASYQLALCVVGPLWPPRPLGYLGPLGPLGPLGLPGLLGLHVLSGHMGLLGLPQLKSFKKAFNIEEVFLKDFSWLSLTAVPYQNGRARREIGNSKHLHFLGLQMFVQRDVTC